MPHLGGRRNALPLFRPTVPFAVIVKTNEVKLEYELQGAGEPVALVRLSLYIHSFAPLVD
jgi:hypothetical protein